MQKTNILLRLFTEKTFYGILLLLCTINMVSCEFETVEITDFDGEDVLVQLSVNLPVGAIPSPISTRSGAQTSSESEIEQIKLLVFDSNTKFAYMADGTSISNSGENKVQFNARLKTSSTALKIYLVANAASVFDTYTPSIGDNITTVSDALSLQFPQTGLTGKLPMVGYCGVNNLNSSQANSLANIKMLRAIARADIVVDEAIQTPFEIVDARVYRGNKMIRLIPSPEPADWSSPKVTSPSVIWT